MTKKMNAALIFAIFMLTQTANSAEPDIQTILKCKVTFQNYIDTENYTPEVYASYSDGHEVGDILTLSIRAYEQNLQKLGIGFHAILMDDARDSVVFSAITSANINMPDYPKVVTFTNGLGITSTSVTGQINYREDSLYAIGHSWGIMPLNTVEAKLNLVSVGKENYRGTLIVEPSPLKDNFMFEFTQLECSTLVDSFDEFLQYYSN